MYKKLKQTLIRSGANTLKLLLSSTDGTTAQTDRHQNSHWIGRFWYR